MTNFTIKIVSDVVCPWVSLPPYTPAKSPP
jgi:hypothetical protein